MDKDLKRVIAALEAQGFTVTFSTKGHPRVFRDGVFVTTFSGTASDWRSIKNGIAQAKRHGFRWPPK